MLKIAIVESNKAEARALKQVVELFFDQYEIECLICVYSSASLGIFALQESFDIWFIDLCSGGSLDEFEFTSIVREYRKDSLVILTDKNRSRVLDGYAVQADAYLVKPYEQSAVFDAISRALKHSSVLKNFVLLGDEHKTYRVDLRSICNCRIDSHRISISLVDRKEGKLIQKIFLFSSMRPIKELLKRQDCFFEADRGCIINFDYVKHIEEKESKVVLSNGDVVNIALTHSRDFRNRLESYNIQKLML